MGAEEVVPEKPVKEQIREQKRSVDRSKRSLEREAKKLERERKKMLAKDIVRSKNQQAKLEQFIGQLNAVSLRIGSCASLNELGDAMNNCAKAMTLVSSKLDTKKLAQIGKTLAKQDMMLEMKSDMMSEVLDSLDDETEEESEELYNQVLMEAGVNMQDEMNVGLGGEKNKEEEKNKPMAENIQSGVDDLDQMLKDLNQK